MRAILFGVLAFVIGLGAATAIMIVRAGESSNLPADYAAATGRDDATTPDGGATGDAGAFDTPATDSAGLGVMPDGAEAAAEVGAAQSEGAPPAQEPPPTDAASGTGSTPSSTAAAGVAPSVNPAATTGAAAATTGAAAAATPPATGRAGSQALASEAPGPPIPEQRLGKIFGAMQPREAARVLEQMDDTDVAVILGMLNDRQAAAVLASLPAERAAAISRVGTGRIGSNR